MINISQFRYLKFEYLNCEYTVTLVNLEGFPVLKGYGESIVEAINDLHSNLL